MLTLLAAFVVLVGPWPSYGTGFRHLGYFAQSISSLDGSFPGVRRGSAGTLRAGWGVADMTPDVGVPLAGFGGRLGKPSKGVHDGLQVKALAIGDGLNIAVILGADMLLVPDPVAMAVRRAVQARIILPGDRLLFTASHTHSGPGAFAPGLVARSFAGSYDPKVTEQLARCFTEVIVQAYHSMLPAKMAHGRVDAKSFIRNRTRPAGVDSDLHFALIEQENGKRCYLIRFSAHPTILGEDNFLLSADYPGYLQRAIEQSSGGTAIYLGGAVGSMSTQGAQGADGFSRAQMFGEKLAQLVLAETGKQIILRDRLPVAAMGSWILLPPFQLRIAGPHWRLSPLAARILGIPGRAWMQAVRIGDLVLIGIPCDFSGEISVAWRRWAAGKNLTLWATSFCGSYAGYVSPDRYYGELQNQKGSMAYETGLMSWCGPDQEAYFTALMQHMVGVLLGENRQTKANY